MRILVTGASGFVGKAVVKNLRTHGHNVTAPTREQLDVRVIWTSWDGIDAFDFDAVVHLAAKATVRDSWNDVPNYFATNVGGTANLLLEFEPKKIRIVFASSSAVYGPGVTGALHEDLPTRPTNPYAASKIAAEQMLDFQARMGNVGVTTLRLFNVSGALPGITDPDATRIINNCLRAAAGKIPHVTVNGDGSTQREFTHVADVAEAFRLAVESTMIGETRTFNIGTGVGVSMSEVIGVARDVTGVDFGVLHNPPVDEPHTLVADASRAARDLRWTPARSHLEQILTDAWRYR